MNWLRKISVKLSIPDALAVFGFPPSSSPSPDKIKSRWKRLIFEHHPDRGGDEKKAQLINAAYTVLRDLELSQRRNETDFSWQEYAPSGSYRAEPSWSYRPDRSRSNIPPWQTDERSSYNTVGQDRTNLNYCLKEIYDYSIQQGVVEDYTFWAFDGHYFRGVFTAYTNQASLGFGGEVMRDWNSTGGNHYATEAVFASKRGSRQLQAIWLKGSNIADQNIFFNIGGFNLNPSNDTEIMNKIRRFVQGES